MEQRSERALMDFQRNTAFVVIVIFGGFALFVFLAHNLVDVLVPLIWAAFFAVPLTEMISRIDNLLTGALGYFRWCWRGGEPSKDDLVSFHAKTGESHITFGETSREAVKTLTRSLVHPCSGVCLPQSRCCQARIRITELRYTTPSDGDIASEFEVNRLVKNWRYYVKDPGTSDMRFELYVDQECKIKAVIPTDEGRKPLEGTIELDRSSAASWFLSVCICMGFLLAVTYIFVVATALGVDALQKNTKVYGRGIEELMHWGDAHLRNWVPADTLQGLNNNIKRFAKDGITKLVGGLASDLESMSFQLLLFVIYVLFWVFEPIPTNTTVAQLIKDYLLLKTLVCLVFAVLMSGLLYFLSCPLWHIFFVLSFLLNYIPEFGFMIVFALAVPAVILDADLSMAQREANTLMLIVIGFLIKIVTANVLEIQLYTAWGGQFMHMHPVILMALIIFFEKLFGLTGMFLAIPIGAMVKYYVHTATLPPLYLYPTLTVLEGDEVAAHKHFVQDHIRKTEYGATAVPGEKV